MFEQLRKNLSQQSDIALVVAMVGILMVLFTPIPPWLLDLLLVLNLSFALLILLLTFYVDKPLRFSTFPSLLLIATLFRLSLNIAATRLILSDGDAGKVIEAIGTHVVAGNYVIGLIVFVVLIVVQYVVVTNGAQRVAEVAARFTLDSMPGKQMSIDADMNIGIIDEKEAQRRRKEIEKEGNFYGAMDGASKFVKGDAIAGIIIILIDIIGGLTIGVAQLGLSWGEALHTYTLLTVGDGIVTQIPALIISTGTGIIVTRAASDAFLSKEISGQITAYPKILVMIGIGLLLMLALPGIPALPVLLVLLLVGGLAYYALSQSKQEGVEQEADDEGSTGEDASEDIYSSLVVEPVVIEVGKALVGLVDNDGPMMNRIVAYRKQYAMESGLVIPKVRIKDSRKIEPNQYQVSLNGARVATGEIYTDRLMAINSGGAKESLEGITTKEPTYGLPAIWIPEEQKVEAAKRGYTLVDPETVLITHLGEIFRMHAAEILSRQETERLVEQVRSRHASLVDELVPALMSISDIQKVLQLLLAERISIRSIDQILEVLVDKAKVTKDTTIQVEAVRKRLAPLICQSLANAENELYVLVLDPAIEKTMATSLQGEAGSAGLRLDPKFAEQVVTRLAAGVEKMMKANLSPVLLCGPELRQNVRMFTGRPLPALAVLSMNEVSSGVSVKSFGVINV